MLPLRLYREILDVDRKVPLFLPVNEPIAHRLMPFLCTPRLSCFTLLSHRPIGQHFHAGSITVPVCMPYAEHHPGSFTPRHSKACSGTIASVLAHESQPRIRSNPRMKKAFNPVFKKILITILGGRGETPKDDQKTLLRSGVAIELSAVGG